MEQQKELPATKRRNGPFIVGAVVSVIIIALVVVIVVLITKQDNGESNNNVEDSTSSTTKTTESYKQVVCPTVDKYTNCIKNYVGLNASDTCTWRMNGNCMDTYGNGNVDVKFVTNDGQDVNEVNIKNYKVVSQSVEPGTEIKYTYEKGSDGTEFSFIESQNIDSITLNAEVIDSSKQLVTKTKTGQMQRYECNAKDNGQVTDVVAADTGADWRDADPDYDIVNCQYSETSLE